MTVSKIFLYFCLSFIFGIFLDSFFTLSPPVLLAFLILGIFLITVFWKYEKFVVIGFSILFLVVGIWRHQLVEIRNSKSLPCRQAGEILKYNNTGEKTTLIGVILAEPDIREKSIKLTIEVEEIYINENVSRFINGKVLVTTYRYPEYQYGDKLRISGKLETPPVFEGFTPLEILGTGLKNKEKKSLTGFNYKDFLKKDGIYSVMSWPKIELMDSNFGNPVMEILFSFKNKFKETAGQFISPPEVGILEALFFGDEENISKEWKDKLNFTGTRHITAVSGMNVTIIAFLILNFLLLLGLGRQQAFYFSIFLLILYILMIGAPTSAVRAGIMGGLLLFAQYLGRMSQAVRSVVFAATFMLFLNPLLLRLDVGFQLSFLAILGLIYLQPFFFNWLKILPNPKIFPIKTTLSATLAAQVFTLPILIYNFGYIPLVSPITNVLIVPFLAPLTILIFIFGFTAMIFSPLGYILALPTWFCLNYITKIVDFFSQIPWASLFLENTHWIFLVISYLILGFLTWRLQERQKLKFLPR